MEKRPAIFIAIPQELAPLRRAVRRRPGFLWTTHGARHSLETPHDCYDVVLTGPGRRSIESALATVDPSLILHCGIAGALAPGISRGEIFLIEKIRLAADVLEIPLSEKARAFAQTIRIGSLVTVPLPVSSKDKLLMRSHGAADLVDMESRYVADFCAARGIGYLGLRAVSDLADDVVPEPILAAFDGRRFRTSRIMAGILKDPSTLAPLIALARASNRAASNLANFVTNLLAGHSAKDLTSVRPA